MKITYFLLITIAFTFQSHAQIGSVNFIDTSVPTAGISKIQSFDINNDGFKDIITSTTGSLGRIGYYLNQTDNTFSSFNLIDNFEFCRGIAVGDFNNDNLWDIVAIGGTANEVKIYMNNNGSFTSSTIDTNTIILNDVVIADFDQNDSDDIVIIGQHSIDFYRNNGVGSFTKEEILSTSTSPFVLECLDLAAKDMDNDGDMDLISGETAGLVIYINNSNGIFTPHYYSTTTEELFLIHPMDIDGDGYFDVVGKNAANQVKWFSNNGSGVMTYQATLATIPNLISLDSIDYNNDGLEDIYASYANHISVFANNVNHNFNTEVNVYQNNSLIMGQVAIANIDNQGGLDYAWSGGNNTLAFHLNQSALATNDTNRSPLVLYPNPTSGILNASTQMEEISVYNLIGEKLMKSTNLNTIDLSNLANGIYLLNAENKGENSIQKIVKK